MPIRYPRVLIVDAPTPTANVLYDFQDDTQPLDTGSKTGLQSQSWKFGDLQLLGEPDAVGVDWALRRLSLTQEITGLEPAVMARQGAMARALMRRRFWVKFQLKATTTPVYWHAYRTPPGDLSLERVYNDDNGPLTDTWEISGGIDADPFSFADRVTQATKTIGNDPANDASAPSTGYVLPTVKGDAPTRLRVKVTPGATTPSGSLTRADSRWLVSCVASSRSAPILRRDIGGTDGFTPANGTAASAAYTGAVGGNARTLTFGSARALANRLSGPVPTATGVPTLPGRYLTLLRCIGNTDVGATALNVTFQLRANTAFFTTGPALTSIVSETFVKNIDNSTFWHTVPLGVISVNEDTTTDAAVTTPRRVELHVGTSNAQAENPVLTLDQLIFIPISGPDIASTTTLIVDYGSIGPDSARPLNLDGDIETAWVGADDYRVAPVCAGSFPIADPAAAYNVLYVTPLKAAENYTPAHTAIAAQAAVDVSCHPRSAYLGDGVPQYTDTFTAIY